MHALSPSVLLTTTFCIFVAEPGGNFIGSFIPPATIFTLVLSGQMHFILGDEDRVVGPGTLVHIPRNTRHRSRPVNGPATFVTVKSPAGDGRLDQDYQMRPEAKEIEALYPGNR